MAPRRWFAPGLTGVLALWGPAASSLAQEDPLGALLAERVLGTTKNPVAADFLAHEGATWLAEERRADATEQLKRALRSQTNVMVVTMQGVTAGMNTDSMRQQQEWSRRQMSTGGMVKQAMGIGPPPPEIDGEQMEREMKQAMADPWVRAIAAAEALAGLGDAQAAGRFYVNCLQMLEAAWVPDACLQGIVDLGPRRGEALLSWMLENADTVSLTAGGAFGEPPPERPRNQPPDRGMVQLRNAALAGLGALAGAGALEPARQEEVVATLLRYAAGKENEPYFRGAADGLGRSRDPRAVEPLRRLARHRDPPETKQAALRGLAMGFGDEAAIRQLRQELDDRDVDEQLRAAQALYEMGDEAAFGWAADVIAQRRTTDAKKPDIRAQVVRDLVELGGERAQGSLAEALGAGPGNDWVAAWSAVGLLELGDLVQLSAVETALGKEDWQLDPRGFRSVWRAIKPFLSAAVTTAVSGGLAAPSAIQQAKQAAQLVGNLVQGERARSDQKAAQRESLTRQLRCQAAAALAAAAPPEAGALLGRLLADPDPAVRLAAAHGFAVLDRSEALDGIGQAFALDFGGEEAAARAAEVRAALLRAALIRFPDAPVTTELVTRADPDPAVRFIGLVAQQRPAAS
jgi:hypothetical protein